MIQSGSSMRSLWIFLTVTLAICSCYPVNQIPGYIKPQEYDLHISINDDGSFEGVVTIKFETGSDTPSNVTNIVLNSEMLDVNSAFLRDSIGKEEDLHNFSRNHMLRTIDFHLKSPLAKNLSYSMQISFSGNSSTDGRGLHSLNHLKGFYMTNLRPIYSRRLFPCFDTPNKKAVFNLTVDTKSNYVISNTPLLERTNMNDRFRHTFKKTPKIPVHSLFFLTGPTAFTNLGRLIWGNVSLNVYPQFPKIMFFNSLLQITNSSVFYKLWELSSMEKLDVLVVPELVEPFYAGYGVLVLREELAKMNIYEATTQIKLEMAYEVLEGLLNVFYGSVVSTRQWEKNWLTSSIAHYLKFRAFNTNYEWGNPDDFMLFDLHFKTLSSSWDQSSDPVQPAAQFNDTNELERFITGSSQIKGASVLYMLETLIPGSKLEKVLIEFLSKNKYNDGVDETDLLGLLSMLVINLPVKMDDFLDTWIKKSGLPMVYLKRDYEGVSITESVYSRDDEKDNGNVFWNMPVTYATQTNQTDYAPIWFLNKKSSVMLNESVTNNDWVVLALDGKLPIVSNYDMKGWFLIGEALQESMNSLSPSTRAKLIGDAFQMAKEEKASYTYILNLLRYLDRETAMAPWLKAIEGFKEMYSWIFYNTNATLSMKTDFEMFVTERMSSIYQELGFEQNETDHQKNMLRKEIVGAMCYFGYKPCQSKAMELYLNMQNNKYTPSNDMRANLICAGMRNVKLEKDWLQMYYKLMNQTDTDPVLDIHLDVLACPTGHNSNAIRKYLTVIFLEKNTIPVAKIPAAYRAVYTKAEHIDQALYFILNRSNKIKKISVHKLAELLNEVSDHISTPYHDKLLKAFLDSHKSAPKPLLDAVKLGRVKVQKKQMFIMKNMNDIHAGLDTEPTAPPSPDPYTTPSTGTSTATSTGTSTATSTATSTGTSTAVPTGVPITTTRPQTTGPPTRTTHIGTTNVPGTTPAQVSGGLSVGSISLITVGVIVAAVIIGLIFYYSCKRGGCCA